MTQHDAFILLSLPNAQLTSSAGTQAGTLDLECVTISPPPPGRDVFLVLRLNGVEAPIDPARTISASQGLDGGRTYTFRPCESDNGTFTIVFPHAGEKGASYTAQDLETFESILSQYADFHASSAPVAATTQQLAQDHVPHMERNSGGAYEVKDAKEDYRGHLVLVDELNGEVLGAVGGQAPVSADPTLSDRESVLIDVGRSGELDARTVFVQKIPTDEHTYLTRGASMLSYGISGAANIIASGMTGASRMYVARASPHPSADPKTPPEQRAPPPRAVTWMTSAGARKGMGQAQTATGKAVQISGKTVAAVEGFVRRTAQQVARAGTKNLDFEPKDKGKQRGEYHPVAYSPGPYLSTSPTQSVATLPPAYSEKPALPPRGPPLPPRTEKGAPPGSPGPSKSAPGSPTMGSQRLRTRDKVVASAELIFSTLDQSTKRLLDVGSEAISTAVGHKYGAEAGHSTRLMTGTVRNVGLIYVDIKGLGHRALLKTAGVEIVKTRMKDGREVKLKTDAGGVVLDAQVEAPQKR